MRRRLLLTLAGLAICFALQIFAEEKEATPTPTLGEHYTQVLPDQSVTFWLLAPKANAVKVMIGVKSGVYEPQGTTTAEMTKQENDYWTATLGPFDPNLYEYQFDIDGVLLPDPSNEVCSALARDG
jgi:1,4-alpha-glucan branching enzyme